ncbi:MULTISPECIES: L-fucose:H+ symporter permease [Sphingobacterium]|uniref:L-fucose:H+ symporter permease n=1 Tax=Sphingobacterium tenebrionis TaxID=3111775 RepID=A0ABU8I2H1_9SPHI|nr:L-fucose:H+ symporter permease [Sphingobacterium sp. CZ-2]QBR11771.1 L-fucose:H+ symporter permease [Sphingobacterium sp. CZ-2]
MSKANNTLAIILITSLFFFWGFIHNLDPILIAHLRSAFSLSHLQASLIDSAVFVAYFVMAIPAGIFMKKYGYKTAILIGLLLFAVGCFLFVPAANTMSYLFFLMALFVLACGITILETAANPYMTVLGDPSKATQRLNFAQSFNGLASFVAPLLGGYIILAKPPLSHEEVAALDETARTAYIQAETAIVKGPYIVLGCVILLAALLFALIKLPEAKEEGDSNASVWSAFRHKNVRWAVIAQFFYVGAQICVLSFIILFATEVAGIQAFDAKDYAAIAGLLIVIGRFLGTFLMRYILPSKLLLIYAVIACILTLISIFASGMVALYSMVAIAFFMSIMFPTIFAMGVEGIGGDTKSASSLIIMAIVGGAIFPPLLGYISDSTGHMQYGYFVVLVCFFVVVLFALNNKSGEQVISTKNH